MQMIPLNCPTIEELLIKKTIEKLSDKESAALQNHLKTCASCKQFASSLEQLRDSMQIDDHLQPHTALLKKLQKKISKADSAKPNWMVNLVQRLTALLQYRIPLYQATLAIILILIIFGLSLNFNFSFLAPTKNSGHLIPYESVTYDAPYMLNILSTLDTEKVGISAQEDTLLTRFIFTSM